MRVKWEFGEGPLRGRRYHEGCGGGVTLHEGKPRCHRCGAVDDDGGGGWRKRLMMWNWLWISMENWPGWDLAITDHGLHPPYAELAFTQGAAGRSRIEIVDQWDNLATGLFYS